MILLSAAAAGLFSDVSRTTPRPRHRCRPSGARGRHSRRARSGPARRAIIGPPRGVAQSGSAPGWGPGGRRFKSCLPDTGSTWKWPLSQNRGSGHFARACGSPPVGAVRLLGSLVCSVRVPSEGRFEFKGDADRNRAADVVALGVVDAVGGEQVDRFMVAGIFGPVPPMRRRSPFLPAKPFKGLGR